MMRSILLVTILISLPVVSVASSVKVISKHSVDDTVKRYADALKAADVSILSEKNQKKNLPGGFSRTEKEIQFTSPFYGRSISECHRGERKDRPMTTKIYKDGAGQVWLEYATPEGSVNEFGVIECGNEVDTVRRVLGGFADAATE